MLFRGSCFSVLLLVLVGCPSADPALDAGSGDANDLVDGRPPEGPEPCAAGFLGSPSSDPQIELRVIGADGQDAPIADGGDAPIVSPPQGGRVIFVGVRATNVDACGLQLTGGIHDPSTKQVRFDARTVNLNAGGDGWGTSANGDDGGQSSAIASYSNIPVCPNEWASADIFDHAYELTMTLKERSGRSTTKTIQVTPRCAEPGAPEVECRCICKLGYVLGENCSG